MNESTLNLFESLWDAQLELLAEELELTVDYVMAEFVIDGELISNE